MNLHISTFTRRITLLIMGCLMLTITTFSQGGPGGDGELNEPDIPIDGGISLLLAAGAVYGIKRQRKNRVTQQ